MDPPPGGSVSALHAQLGLGGALDSPVDESDLLLGQRSLHVAVDDAVTLTPPTGPEGRWGRGGERERRRVVTQKQ